MSFLIINFNILDKEMEKINSLLPVIFFGHDNPMNGISNNKFTKSWL